VLLHKHMVVVHLFLDERAEYLRGLFRLLLAPLPASVDGGVVSDAHAQLIRRRACIALLAATRALRLTAGACRKPDGTEDGELYPAFSAIDVLGQVRRRQLARMR
jgi:hypothetical protein